LSKGNGGFPFLKHLGIYGYRVNAARLVKFPRHRWNGRRSSNSFGLEHGIEIAVVRVNYEPSA